MKILFITDMFPYPSVSGDTIRVYNLLRKIANKNSVWFFSILSFNYLNHVQHLQEFCSHVEADNIPRQNPINHLPGLLRFAVSGKPVGLKFFESKNIKDKIREITRQEHFDIAYIEHSYMAFYQEFIAPHHKPKLVLDFHNITYSQYDRIFRIEKQPIQKFRTWLHSVQMKKWEPKYAAHFDRCLTVSEIDRQEIIKANPRLNVDVVPNGVDVQKYQPLASQHIEPKLLFIGSMDYTPCVDAVLHYCGEIFPAIQRKIPTAQLWVVGRNPIPEIMKLQSNCVHVTGYVQDIIPYYQQSAISVVPLRAGGGTRLKILEAMALGRPVVSTAVGCEGLDVNHDEHLLIADTPDLFADQVIRLLKDPVLYKRIKDNARQLVVRKYSWDVIADRLMSIFSEIA